MGKLIGQKGLSHQNVMRISSRVVDEFNAWKGFLEDLVRRGMSEPMLTVIDGCPGLLAKIRASKMQGIAA
ncbi:MAG: hypothetical protein CVV37_02615 [Nitrospira bacterium HGW-Nitrospira-1]|nr:MAG: hypothetical protein CVV37_02615 [Nitrospira bacterium HGW-Nitrospira-1]